MKPAIAYIRVSTQRQGASGLGLEAQEAAVESFCNEHGFTILKEYREIESGRHNERPVLRQALAHAKKAKATLLIAKLDRLARNVHFISGLMESDVQFRACDLPEANRLLLHIMASVAEAEAKAISDRTVVALQAAKARGKALGASNPASRNLTAEARLKGASAAGKTVHEQAREADAEVLPLIKAMREKGMALRTIAEHLTADGYLTRKGLPWNQVQVLRVLKRAA